MEHQKRLNWLTVHKRPYSAEVGILHNNPRRAFGADIPSLLSPFLPGEKELHLLLIQWVPVG